MVARRKMDCLHGLELRRAVLADEVIRFTEGTEGTETEVTEGTVSHRATKRQRRTTEKKFSSLYSSVPGEWTEAHRFHRRATEQRR